MKLHSEVINSIAHVTGKYHKIPDIAMGIRGTVTNWRGHAMSKGGSGSSDSANYCQARVRSMLQEHLAYLEKWETWKYRLFYIKVTDFKILCWPNRTWLQAVCCPEASQVAVFQVAFELYLLRTIKLEMPS